MESFGDGVEVDTMPRLDKTPTAKRSPTERFNEAMEDGHMDVREYVAVTLTLAFHIVFCCCFKFAARCRKHSKPRWRWEFGRMMTLYVGWEFFLLLYFFLPRLHLAWLVFVRT